MAFEGEIRLSRVGKSFGRVTKKVIKRSIKTYKASRGAASYGKTPEAVFSTKTNAEKAAKGTGLKVKKTAAWGVFAPKKSK